MNSQANQRYCGSGTSKGLERFTLITPQYFTDKMMNLPL